VRTRNVIVGAIVLVVATAAATSAVVLNLRRPESGSIDGVALATVVVPTEDIPRNQPLDPLIAQGYFKEIEIPLTLVLDAAITDLRDLEGTTTVAVILQNEQMVSHRLTGGIFGTQPIGSV
jgi:hypothetical protein